MDKMNNQEEEDFLMESFERGIEQIKKNPIRKAYWLFGFKISQKQLKVMKEVAEESGLTVRMDRGNPVIYR